MSQLSQASKECQQFIRPVRDVIELIGGKWKLPVIVALSFGNQRFKQLERLIEGITPRMLSKELKDLEVNGLVNRKVYDTTPVTVEYSLTEYGKSLDELIAVLRKWGLDHRERIMQPSTETEEVKQV
ncbi:transcriptional regulator [marine bacterium AO1-C]|nr:transcriptional regulator [marine bacterium AO1-C]